jgi:hypothetical protein
MPSSPIYFFSFKVVHEEKKLHSSKKVKPTFWPFETRRAILNLIKMPVQIDPTKNNVQEANKRWHYCPPRQTNHVQH